MSENLPTTSPHWPLWFRAFNLIVLALVIALILGFLVVSLETFPPYDFMLLMNGADDFCFDTANFAYGRAQNNYYPAPFYTTFCLPYRYAPVPLRFSWLIIPAIMAFLLAGRRAAVLAYPPLFILIFIGQSSWLIVPVFMLAFWYARGHPVRWWHGFIMGLAVFKPHIALPAVLYLLWKWRTRWRPFALACVTVGVIVLPAFVVMPDWIFQWLPNGRGFEPVNLASIAYVPVRLFNLSFAPGTMVQIMVWGFCVLTGVGLYFLLRWRRGKLEFYDWILLFMFVNPVLNDYDLVILLPFIGRRLRLLLLANVVGIVVWLYAMMSGVVGLAMWNMSFYITLILLIDRLVRVDREDKIAPVVRW